MTIVVTGANGFVGSAVVRRLESLLYPVRACIRPGRVFQSQTEQCATVHVADLNETTNWSTALIGATAVVHTAARVHVMSDTARDPLTEFRQVNVEGTLNLARQANSAGVKRFVFLSSIKVNGEATLPGQPFNADEAPHPLDPYGISKLEAEVGLIELARKTEMEVVIVRPPLVYGPGVRANFATMMRWLARGTPLPLGAIRENRRSLVALDNLVDLLINCVHHPAAANQTFLVSDGEDLSTTDLLHRMGQAMGKPARLLPIPINILRLASSLLGKRNMAQRLLGDLQVNINKTREFLNWSPPISVDEGLRRAAQGLNQNEETV